MMQLKLCGPKTDPTAPLKKNVALADFLHGHNVLQTDQMLPKFLEDAEERVTTFLTNETVLAMDCPSMAGLMVAHDDAREEDDERPHGRR